MPAKITVLVFDVNETLLDIEALDPLFSRLFGDKQVMREWFAQLVLYSQSITLAGIYSPFGDLAVGVLRMLGETRRVPIHSADATELRSMLGQLPPHPDAAPALSRIKDAGFRLATLTNSPPDPLANPLHHSELDRYFEFTSSVHEVRRFKPAPETYRSVAHALGVELPCMCLVAAHMWDTLGAQAIGCASALVTRAGNAPLPVNGIPQPAIVAPDLGSLATEVIRRWS